MTPFGRLNAIRDLRCLPCAPKAVLLALALRSDEAGACFPSIPTVAGDAGLSRSTTIEAIARLEREGWIAVERVPGRVSRVRIVDATLASPPTRPNAGRVPVQSPDTHPSECRTGTRPIPGRGGPNAGRGGPVIGHEQYKEQITEQRETRATPTAVDAPAPRSQAVERGAPVGPSTPTARVVIEPAELERLSELYAEAMQHALRRRDPGRVWGLPRNQRWALGELAAVYGGPTRAERLAWLQPAVARFVDALEGDRIGFGSGFPRAFERWLADGQPSRPRDGPRGGVAAIKPPYHEEWRPEEA